MNVSATFTYIPAICLGDALMPATCFLKYNFSKIHIMVVRGRIQKVNGGEGWSNCILFYSIIFYFPICWCQKKILKLEITWQRGRGLWHSLVIYVREKKTGTHSRNWAELLFAGSLTQRVMSSKFSYTEQDRLTRDGAVCRELGHPISINNQDNHGHAYGSTWWKPLLYWDFPSVILSYVSRKIILMGTGCLVTCLWKANEKVSIG